MCTDGFSVSNWEEWKEITKDFITTHDEATQTTSGLMSSSDKTKLDKLKEAIVLSQSEFDSLSDIEKNDDTKIYFIKE